MSPLPSIEEEWFFGPPSPVTACEDCSESTEHHDTIGQNKGSEGDKIQINNEWFFSPEEEIICSHGGVVSEDDIQGSARLSTIAELTERSMSTTDASNSGGTGNAPYPSFAAPPSSASMVTSLASSLCMPSNRSTFSSETSLLEHRFHLKRKCAKKAPSKWRRESMSFRGKTPRPQPRQSRKPLTSYRRHALKDTPTQHQDHAPIRRVTQAGPVDALDVVIFNGPHAVHTAGTHVYEVTPGVFTDKVGRPVSVVPYDATPLSVDGRGLMPKPPEDDVCEGDTVRAVRIKHRLQSPFLTLETLRLMGYSEDIEGAMLANSDGEPDGYGQTPDTTYATYANAPLEDAYACETYNSAPLDNDYACETYKSAPLDNAYAYETYNSAPVEQANSYETYNGAPVENACSYETYNGAPVEKAHSYEPDNGASVENAGVFEPNAGACIACSYKAGVPDNVWRDTQRDNDSVTTADRVQTKKSGNINTAGDLGVKSTEEKHENRQSVSVRTPDKLRKLPVVSIKGLNTPAPLPNICVDHLIFNGENAETCTKIPLLVPPIHKTYNLMPQTVRCFSKPNTDLCSRTPVSSHVGSDYYFNRLKHDRNPVADVNVEYFGHSALSFVPVLEPIKNSICQERQQSFALAGKRANLHSEYVSSDRKTNDVTISVVGDANDKTEITPMPALCKPDDEAHDRHDSQDRKQCRFAIGDNHNLKLNSPLPPLADAPLQYWPWMQKPLSEIKAKTTMKTVGDHPNRANRDEGEEHGLVKTHEECARDLPITETELARYKVDVSRVSLANASGDHKIKSAVDILEQNLMKEDTESRKKTKLKFSHYSRGVGVFLDESGTYVDVDGRPVSTHKRRRQSDPSVTAKGDRELVKLLRGGIPTDFNSSSVKFKALRESRIQDTEYYTAVPQPDGRTCGGNSKGKLHPLGGLVPDRYMRALVDNFMLKRYRSNHTNKRASIVQHKGQATPLTTGRVLYNIKTGRAEEVLSRKNSITLTKERMSSQSSIYNNLGGPHAHGAQRNRYDQCLTQKNHRLQKAKERAHLAHLKTNLFPWTTGNKQESKSMSNTRQKPGSQNIHFKDGTADIVNLVPIRNLDLTGLSYSGTKGTVRERPVKGFRTKFAGPAPQNTNIIREEWKIKNCPPSQTSSRRATPHHSRDSKDIDGESQASGGTDGSGISRRTRTTTVSSLKSTRQIISVKTTERKPFFEPLQLLRTGTMNETTLKGEVYMVPGPRDAANLKEDPRQTVNMPTVSVPRKGLIKLTGLPYEIDNPEYFDDRKERPAPEKMWDHTKFSYVAPPSSPEMTQQGDCWTGACG